MQEGDGIPDLATTKEVVAALKRVGFEVLDARDLANETEVPWYKTRFIHSNRLNSLTTGTSRLTARGRCRTSARPRPAAG